MDNKKKKRNEAVDIAKALGIILVVLGHTQFWGKNFIYQFHLPLFFFLSGFVFDINKLKNPKNFIIKRIKSLYLPFVIFETIFLIFHNFFVKIGFYNSLSNVQLTYNFNEFISNFFKILTMGHGEQLAGPLWFLISTLEINFIFAILVYISSKFKKKMPIILLGICTILFFVGCYTDLPRMLSQSFIGMFFYCCGYIYKLYESKIKFKFRYFILSFIILIICTKFNNIDISQLEITYKILLIISGIAGTYFIMFISNKCTFFKYLFILYCGKNTIYILALHCIVFKIIMLIEIVIYNENIELLGMFPVYQKEQIWSLIFTVAGMIIPILVKKCIDNICKIPKIYKEKLLCTKSQ